MKRIHKMKKIISILAIAFMFMGSANAQVFLMDENDGRDPSVEPFIPGHGVNWDQGYVPVGSGAALLIGFGAAYLLAKKKREE